MEHMRGLTPSSDRSLLARMKDDILESRILLNSAFSYIGLSEHLRRVEQLRKAKIVADEALQKSDEENANLQKKLADVEETLRLATEGID
ncbi:unnamed protein product [Cuscuta europaea]|uniref:Uncharacterized protein n=1 Tax=Cuscuta europaea TaxID=41803 RepID=A0A9P1E9W3_CUSEU|nr:unnamed protein product [Cuscuta europaea]